MKGDHMGILEAYPTQRELPLSNWERFSRTAHLVRCSTPPSFGPTSWWLGQWAARPGAEPLARGLSTKIHLKVDLDGRPFAFHLTAGQASDSPQFEILLDLGPDIMPRAVVG